MVAERWPRWQRRQTLNTPSPMDTLKLQLLIEKMGFPGSTVVSNPTTDAGDARVMGSIPGTEKKPGGGTGSPFTYSCLGNPMDRGAWHATVHGVAKNWTQFSN